ncbi:hypothetical protein P4N68_13095 [Corynebacterium felinum]|uniref:ABC-2 family transporter protein n=1 Tax=Corynebacterium felinum TaxID=131318 RepID=A0ABU2B957_9CORY|nr:hypothetical protein [Corynebacterium felinum]MDF5822005.1 hypothetical protein [Corynebacterium felinum]MDR7355175.1 hypothetical protein [Corynebacterium felinum]WJY94526.1 hypothetical protein CFELI_04480 [Corynebacterium felinum]
MLAFVALISVAALQNFLALVFRGFATSVGVCLGLSILSFVAISNSIGALLRFFVPYALMTFSLAFNSPAFALDPELKGTSAFIQVFLTSCCLTAVSLALNYFWMRKKLSAG